MMFVTKIAAPLPSSTAALLLTSPEMMRASNRTADNVLSTVMAARDQRVALRDGHLQSHGREQRDKHR